MKKLLPLLVPAIMLLNGCSNESEVRNMSFVQTIGTDISEDGMKNAALRLYGSEDILTGKGKTIFSAVENAETAQDKSLFSGHTELFVSGEGDFMESLELLIKNNRISPSCMFACTDEKAEDILSGPDGASLSGLIESGSRNGSVLRRNISDVLDDMLGSDGMAAVPVVNSSGLNMAVINSEKIVGILTGDESRGLCWLNGTIHDIYLPVTVSEDTTDFFVRKTQTKLTAETENDDIIITVEIKINGNAQNEHESSTQVRRQAAEQISSLCAKAVSTTVNVYGADVFGIEKCIRSSGIKTDAEWKDIISGLQFRYRIKIAE
ncbi:MAG: Ger(x)C family spore germination C-terminal domain-containing protein [Porcipelethomonas sp.]